jgi:hypothetical protein
MSMVRSLQGTAITLTEARPYWRSWKADRAGIRSFLFEDRLRLERTLDTAAVRRAAAPYAAEIER